MKRYLKYIKPYGIFFILAPLFMLVEVYCDVMIPSLAADIINTGVANESVSQIIQSTLFMILHVCIAVCAGSCASFCSAKASVNFACDLRMDIFRTIQNFSFANVDKYSKGSLVTRLTNDVTQMQTLVNLCLRMAFRSPGMLIGALIMAFTINSEVAMIFVVLVPMLAIIIAVLLTLAYKRFERLQTKIDGLNSNISEFLTNIRLVKALTREDYESEKFEKVNSDLKTTALSAYRITILQMPIMTFAINMCTIAVVWLGSIALGKGTMLVGDISAFITYLTQILMSVMMLAIIFMQYSRAMASDKRIKEVFNTKVDILDGENKDLLVKEGNIEFKNVNFKYFENNKELVLEDISVKIKAGQTVGIIGSTGSGKTSFVHLIARLYDTNSGEVLVDGVNVRDYSLENLRDGISVVLQNNVLFSGTIEDNLRWGNKDADKEEIQKIANWAAAHDFILEQEDGYDTNLGQGGVNLSGGQKQRLCIARALLKNPKILVLDDSTSAVDTATEAKINSHLANDLNKTTKLIIAQRITSVQNADLIIVMDDGKIESTGTHDELMLKSEAYKEIFNSQTSKEATING